MTRGGALALPASLVARVVLATAPAAYADTVDVDYVCQTPIGQKSGVSPIEITAAPTGSSYKITMSFRKGVSSSPIELGKGAMNPSAVIKLGGADSGTLPVTGPPNAQPIPANTPIKVSDLTGTYTPKASGTVTFTAGTLTIKALGTDTTCNASNTPGPSLTLSVTSSGGSSSGGSSGGGASGGSTAAGSTAGTLPTTGPDDSTIALGTFGGTVLLAGVGGVLWLTRRSQTR